MSPNTENNQIGKLKNLVAPYSSQGAEYCLQTFMLRPMSQECIKNI